MSSVSPVQTPCELESGFRSGARVVMLCAQPVCQGRTSLSAARTQRSERGGFIDGSAVRMQEMVRAGEEEEMKEKPLAWSQ